MTGRSFSSNEAISAISVQGRLPAPGDSLQQRRQQMKDLTKLILSVALDDERGLTRLSVAMPSASPLAESSSVSLASSDTGSAAAVAMVSSAGSTAPTSSAAPSATRSSASMLLLLLLSHRDFEVLLSLLKVISSTEVDIVVASLYNLCDETDRILKNEEKGKEGKIRRDMLMLLIERAIAFEIKRTKTVEVSLPFLMTLFLFFFFFFSYSFLFL